MRIGEVVEGRYRVDAVLGQGGMGTVYRVRHLEWDVDLAVKRPRPDRLADAGQFVAEAQTWVELGLHPHVCSCYYVRTIDGVPTVFAEYLAGGSLADSIADRRLYAGGEATALDRILDVAVQTAWGLEHAHSRGLVHQDVKPANVLLDPSGVAKVTDFGIARAGVAVAAGPGEGDLDVTVRGMTVRYASPEQGSGRRVGQRSDIFSFAVAVLEMFTGEASWAAGVAAPYVLAEYRPEPGLPRLPAEVAALLQRCLRTDPALRPRTMGEVAAELAAARARLTQRERPVPRAADLRAGELNNRALSLLDLGLDAQAERAFDEAYGANPLHLPTLHNVGLLAWRAGGLTDEQVIARLEGARRDTGDSEEIRHLLGHVQWERGDLTAARALLGPDAVPPGVPDGSGPLAWTGFGRPELKQDLESLYFAFVNPVALADAQPRPDGSTAVTAVSGGPRHTVRVWDATTGRVRTELSGHTAHVLAVAVTADGRTAVSAAADRTVRVWDVEAAVCLRVFEIPAPPADPRFPHPTFDGSSVGLSADGRWAVWGGDGDYRWWDLRTGLGGTLASGRSGGIVAVAGAGAGTGPGPGPGPARMVVALDGEIRPVDLSGETPVLGAALPDWHGTATAIALSADGRYVAVGGVDGTIHLWTDGNRTAVLREHLEEVLALSLHPASGLLLSGGMDKSVRLWDVESGRCLRTDRGHSMRVAAVRLQAGRDTAVSVARDDTVRTWALPGGHKAPTRLARPRPTSEIEQAGTRFAALLAAADQALDDGRHDEALALLRQARAVPGHERDPEALRLWQVATAFSVRTGLRGAWHISTRRMGEVRSGIRLGRQHTAALAGSTGRLAIVDLSEPMVLEDVAAHDRVRGGAADVLSLAAASGGRLVASAGRDGRVRLWTTDPLRLVSTLPVEHVRSICFSADEKEVIAATAFGIEVWKPGGVAPRLRWSLGGPRIATSGAAAVQVFGKVLHVAANDATLSAWDLSDGRKLWRTAPRTDILGHTWPGRSVDVSADGRLLLTCFGRDESALTVWDSATGARLREFDPPAVHRHRARAARLLPDGRFALTGGDDRTLRVWNVATGECVHVLEGHQDAVHGVGVLMAGSGAFSWGDDGTLRCWEFDWELAARPPAEWDESATPIVEAYVERLGRSCAEPDAIRELFLDLGEAGYAWLPPKRTLTELRRVATARGLLPSSTTTPRQAAPAGAKPSEQPPTGTGRSWKRPWRR